MQLFNFNLVGLQAQIWEGRQTHSRDQQLSAELKELVKTDNVDEVHFVQATIGVPVLFAVTLKPNCNHDNSISMNSSSLIEELICLLNRNKKAHIYHAFWILLDIILSSLHLHLILRDN